MKLFKYKHVLFKYINTCYLNIKTRVPIVQTAIPLNRTPRVAPAGSSRGVNNRPELCLTALSTRIVIVIDATDATAKQVLGLFQALKQSLDIGVCSNLSSLEPGLEPDVVGKPFLRATVPDATVSKETRGLNVTCLAYSVVCRAEARQRPYHDWDSESLH